MRYTVRTTVAAFALCVAAFTVGVLCFVQLEPLIQDGYYEGYGQDNVITAVAELELSAQWGRFDIEYDRTSDLGCRVTDRGLDPNVWYTVSQNGQELLRGGPAAPALRSASDSLSRFTNTVYLMEGQPPYTVTFYLVDRSHLVNSDISRTIERAISRMADADAYLVGSIVGGAVALVSLAYLVLGALRRARPEGDGNAADAFDRSVPADLCLVLCLALAGFTMWSVPESGWWRGSGFVLFGGVPMALFAACALALGLSFVRRLPGGRWKEGLLVRRLWAKIETTVRFAAGQRDRLAVTIIVFAALSFLEGLCGLYFRWGGWIFWTLLRLGEFFLVVYAVVYWKILREGAHELAAGDLAYRVPVEDLRGPFRAMGEDLSAIRGGIEKAVEEQMRSERMKTELITNVSHDIKTPLTSIVNYVDLLDKEDLPDGPAREYVAVLVRQAARLKKLTEDLVEASKASTGSLEVDLQRTDVNVLLDQSAAEYADRLRAQDLTLVLRSAEGEALVLADGRLLWRIFENLLGNIVKYALPGTRVYLSCTAEEGTVRIVFRNISRDPLDVPAEELIERFVRGDAARSTEGSGLGLAIANSLTELQHGTFALDLDGDLFKVTLTFPRLEEETDGPTP